MASRLFPRLILLVSLVALFGSAYVASGLGRITATDVASGVSRSKVPDVASGVSRTSTPSNAPDDGVWEAATRVATISGSSFRIRTEYVRVASFAYGGAPATVRTVRTRDFPNLVHDRSPLHSVPLLI
jgi:hypothetical protein